eukprot:g4069.t1
MTSLCIPRSVPHSLISVKLNQSSLRRFRKFIIHRAKPSESELKKDIQNASNNVKITSSLSERDDSKTSDQITWDWFEWDQYNTKWEVPWGAPTLVLGMVGWLASSVAVGFLAIPQIVKLSGLLSFSQFSRPEKAFVLLGVQVLETLVGMGIICIVTSRWTIPVDGTSPGSQYNLKSTMAFLNKLKMINDQTENDRTIAPSSKLFRVSIKDPFETRYGWLVWALLGIPLSVGANAVVSFVLNYFGTEMSGNGTIQSIVGMLSLDFPTYIALITVVGFLAPLLEETVFRGFLLTTLTKWMPTYQAVILSSILFGCAHLSPKDFPYLTVVSIVWGFMYVRSRNLLTPMFIHGLWNSTVLSLLFALDSMGVDLSQLP